MNLTKVLGIPILIASLTVLGLLLWAPEPPPPVESPLLHESGWRPEGSTDCALHAGPDLRLSLCVFAATPERPCRCAAQVTPLDEARPFYHRKSMFRPGSQGALAVGEVTEVELPCLDEAHCGAFIVDHAGLGITRVFVGGSYREWLSRQRSRAPRASSGSGVP